MKVLKRLYKSENPAPPEGDTISPPMHYKHSINRDADSDELRAPGPFQKCCLCFSGAQWDTALTETDAKPLLKRDDGNREEIAAWL